MKKLLGVMLLLAVSSGIRAQGTGAPCNNTFVKEVDGIGTLEPRVFRDPVLPNFYITSNGGNTTYLSGVDISGTVLWTQAMNFVGDNGTVVDMIVDQIDGTLAGVVRGVNSNYMFKYDIAAASFNWIKKYPSNYLFQNIHQTGTNYVVTGEVLSAQLTIFQVDRITGAMSGYQNAGVTGEFFSTYDAASGGVYGACRYYSSGSLFNPSLFEFSAGAGNNLWINTYIANVAGSTARIYPVAPIVDGPSLVQLSSGDPTGFNTYQTGPTSVFLLKTDLAGNLNWTWRIDIPGFKQLNAKKIINTATGYYLLIDSYNGTINDFFFVVKTDKNGKVQWINRYGISGENTVITGVENNGYLYLTALSQSYNPASPILFLKLDPFGLTEKSCPYIRPLKLTQTALQNSQKVKPPSTTATPYSNAPAGVNLNGVNTAEKVFCATTCPPPCSTLTGSLATGVLAFYPFGNGTLSDLSGNGNNLINTTAAFPTADRNSSPNCAYRFNNSDFLTIPAGGSTFLNNITNTPFSVSLWYQPLGTRPVGNYELLVGRGNTSLHCPDTWGEWSVGLYDCRKAVAGFDQYSHWELSALGCNAFMTAISNSWHHLAFVYDGVNYNIYRDGVLSSTSSGPCGPLSGNIGELMLGVGYAGDLDDIIIYNRALTSAEVTTLMNLNGSCCDGVNSTVRQPFTLPALSSVVKVYPNPTDGKVTVSAGQSIIRSVAVYTNTGTLVNTYQVDATSASIDISRMAAGIYFMKVTTDTGISTEKVIKD